MIVKSPLKYKITIFFGLYKPIANLHHIFFLLKKKNKSPKSDGKFRLLHLDYRGIYIKFGEKFEIMEELRYPVGMQTFPNIIEGGYTYVDKTAYIKPLLSQGKFIFLSRPRRFGKSLFLSTLKAYFEGRRELFNGLAADKMNLDWTPTPVLYFDFNSGLYRQPNGLVERIETDLTWLETQFGLPIEDGKNIVTRFGILIRSIFLKTGQPVVILVDEYDKPLLEVEEDKRQFEENQSLLKGFFSNLKSMDAYIKFGMLTRVARFNKVSIFSDLNNINDISIEERYADICGWTEKELVDIFHSGIQDLSKKRKEDFNTTLKALRDYYDGYLFTEEGSRLYNPFSVLCALDKRRIDPYWFDSGTPTFLAKRIRARGTFPPDINGQMCTREELISVGLDDRNPIPLMFQTGYLTIASYHEELGLYELRFPNKEVEIGFYQQLLPIYVPEIKDIDSPFRFPLFKIDLYEGRPDNFMKRLASLFKSLPGEDHRESTYRAITYLLAVLCGTPAMAENHSYKGRSDLEVIVGRYIYLFEFKYNASIAEAMNQIHTRDYAGKYAMDDRTVYLIGVNFNDKKEHRGIEYEIKNLRLSTNYAR